MLNLYNNLKEEEEEEENTEKEEIEIEEKVERIKRKEKEEYEEYLYESYRQILNDVIVIFDEVVEKCDPESNKTYLAYNYRFFTPYLEWKISKRYNDFLKFHLNLEIFDCQDKDFIKLLLFDFPQKQFFSTIEVIEKRKISFQQFLEKCILIPAITMLVVDFLNITPELVRKLEIYLKQLENLSSTSSLLSSSYTPSTTSILGTIDSTSTRTRRGGGGGIASTRQSSSPLIDLSHNELKLSKLPLSHPIKPIRLTSELSLRKESNILNEELTYKLFSFLPEISKTQKFKLLYSTWRDGWNLTTLYENIGTLHPIIFIIQSSEIESKIFGAYISTPVGPPSYQFKGDGQCSIFRLTGSSPVHYSPSNGAILSMSTHVNSKTLKSLSLAPVVDHINIANNTSNDNKDLPAVTSNSPPNNCITSPAIPSNYLLFSNTADETDTIPPTRNSSTSISTTSTDIIEDEITAAIIAYNSTRTQYIFANDDYIAIGGSAKYGTNAIRLSNDLLTCSCGPSDTYGNDIPLVQSETTTSSVLSLSNSLEVQVGEIEVFGVIGIFS